MMPKSSARIGLLPIALFLFAAPVVMAVRLPIDTAITSYDQQRILELAACFVALPTLVLVCPVGWPIRRTVLILAILCLAAGALSTAFAGAAQREAWRDWLTCLLLALTTWGIAQAIAADRERAQWLLLITIGSAASIYMAWTLALNVVGWLVREPGRAPTVLIPGFSNIRYFSNWQGFVLPFVPAAIAIHCRGKWLKLPAVLLACLFYSLAFHSQSRSLFLGQLTAHACLVMFLGRAYRKQLGMQLRYWAGGLLLYWIVVAAGWEPSGQAYGGLLRGSLSGRGILWHHALILSAAHPWLGVGPGLFALYPNSIAAGPHNGLLTVAVEWGWPVALATVLGVATVLRRAAAILRSGDTDRSTAAVDAAMWLSCIALLTQSMVANVVIEPISQIALILTLAWLMALSMPTARSIAGRLVVSGTWLIITVIATLVTLTMIIADDTAHIAERNRDFSACATPPPQFSPHYWQQGWLTKSCP